MTKKEEEQSPYCEAVQGEFRPFPTRQEEQNLLVIRKLVPNSLTILALVTGMSTIPLALDGRFLDCVVCIFVSGALDGLDGPTARFLKSTSRFGAELDSLCDLVNFGVVPSILIYLWRLRFLGTLGWIVSLIWCVCMACRLARFNAGVDFNQGEWSKSYFMGIPAPAGACLCMLPIVIDGGLRSRAPELVEAVLGPRVLVPYYICIAYLLVSSVPTFSSKMISKKAVFSSVVNMLGTFLLITAIVLGSIFDVWLCYLVASIGYGLSMPLSSMMFASLRSKHQKSN